MKALALKTQPLLRELGRGHRYSGSRPRTFPPGNWKVPTSPVVKLHSQLLQLVTIHRGPVQDCYLPHLSEPAPFPPSTGSIPSQVCPVSFPRLVNSLGARPHSCIHNEVQTLWATVGSCGRLRVITASHGRLPTPLAEGRASPLLVFSCGPVGWPGAS